MHGPADPSTFLSETAVFAPLFTNRTGLPAGTIVSFALLVSSPAHAYFNSGKGIQTSEAPVVENAGLPKQLPSASSTIPSTMEMWAYDECY